MYGYNFGEVDLYHMLLKHRAFQLQRRKKGKLSTLTQMCVLFLEYTGMLTMFRLF